MGFKYPTAASHEFPETTLDMQTLVGRERLERTIAAFEEYVAKRKAEEDHFVANKRQIVAAQMHPRWAPSSSHGQ
jgi:alpha-D-ribose 1-methylphosphonate 5-triphosphate diphosphatase PhnM